MTGSKLQLYNGIALIVTFFSCRLLYGTYQSTRVFADVWAAMDTKPPVYVKPPGNDSLAPGTLAYVTEASTVPFWLATSYLISNLTLNSLNTYWFMMMIKAIRKRFVAPATETTQPANKDSSSTSRSQTARSPVEERKAETKID